MNRSEQRIPKLRTRGRANRAKLLREAEHQLAENSGKTLKFSDVFKGAGVSRGSAYRIYIGIDDLMQDLSGEWLGNFVEYVSGIQPDRTPENWMELSDFLVEKGAQYWGNSPETLNLMPRIRSSSPSNYRNAVRHLSEALVDLFDRYFEMPEVQDWRFKVSFYVQLIDITFSDGVRADNKISDQRLGEAKKLGRTYLSFYLPAWIPTRKLPVVSFIEN